MPNNQCIAEQHILSLSRKFQEIRPVIRSILTEVKDKADSMCNMQKWCLQTSWSAETAVCRTYLIMGARFKGTSLNCQLLQGPDLTNSLLCVLTRFRQESVALMTDDQAIFHQVRVSEKHVDFLRCLWGPQDLSETQYTCTSFWRSRMLTELCQLCSSENCRTIRLSLAEIPCQKVRWWYSWEDLTTLIWKGGFQLSKWTSNNRNICHPFLKQTCLKTMKELNLTEDNLPVERAFGLSRCAESDTFMVVVFKVDHCQKDKAKGLQWNYSYTTASLCRRYVLPKAGESGRIHLWTFMLGKARVAPLKLTTVPRLELTAAVLAVVVDTMLRNSLITFPAGPNSRFLLLGSSDSDLRLLWLLAGLSHNLQKICYHLFQPERQNQGGKLRVRCRGRVPSTNWLKTQLSSLA
ncbi:hypothetical protein N1851_033651 [Merluccius polli]|uniref:Uncharacterized protein n=1 Tax=Merluccius polli TaxID=89951 RepID=A0AA47M122_MERPO|nr:hypothetical protein N1851_033651 [Merluccius polli]